MYTHPYEALLSQMERMQEKKDVDGLINHLRTGVMWQIRKKAAYSLGVIGDSRSVKPLMAALEGDPDSGVRGSAAVALREIGNPKAEKALIRALKDEDNSVREYAALGLRVIGGSKAVKPLTKALKDENKEVRKAAEAALKKIED